MNTVLVGLLGHVVLEADQNEETSSRAASVIWGETATIRDNKSPTIPWHVVVYWASVRWWCPTTAGLKSRNARNSIWRLSSSPPVNYCFCVVIIFD